MSFIKLERVLNLAFKIKMESLSNTHKIVFASSKLSGASRSLACNAAKFPAQNPNCTYLLPSLDSLANFSTNDNSLHSPFFFNHRLLKTAFLDINLLLGGSTCDNLPVLEFLRFFSYPLVLIRMRIKGLMPFFFNL